MEWGSSMETETSSMARSSTEMRAATGMVPAWQVLYSVKGKKESQIIKNLDVCPACIEGTIKTSLADLRSRITVNFRTQWELESVWYSSERSSRMDGM